MIPVWFFRLAFVILGYGARSCGAQRADSGKWASWGEWSICSLSCGEGTRTRVRECGDTSNKCLGSRLGVSICNNGPCPTWGSWGTWGRCTTTCGEGARERKRSCNGIGCPGSQRGFGGCLSTCPCPREEHKSIFEQRTDYTGKWKSWGDWSYCSVSCGAGVRKACRECWIAGSCDGPISKSEICEERPCVRNAPKSGEWQNWESWAPCDVTCGEGTTVRSRKCSDERAQCIGKLKESKRCKTVSCNTEKGKIEWAPWSEWTKCSASCGGGFSERRRSCPGKSRSECGTEKGLEFAECNKTPCSSKSKVPNQLLWGPWSPCSHTCGNGTLVRRRKCDPAKLEGCQTRDFETKTCFIKDCPAETSAEIASSENIVLWSSWEPCSATCGPGTRRRKQICFGDCSQARQQQKRCELKSCLLDIDAYSPWSQWSRCTVTCGDGLSLRRRNCKQKTSACSEDTIQSRGCSHFKKCKKTASLDLIDFSESESESESTSYEGSGGGEHEDISELLESLRSPRKPIGNIVFNQNGDLSAAKINNSAAASSNHEKSKISSKNGKASSKWASWTAWGSCSATCGKGTRTRSRTCSRSTGCVGQNLQGVGCLLAVCNEAKHINWGDWSQWNPCSVTCGSGIRKRFRTCKSKGHSFCAGKFRQTEECAKESCELISALSNPAWGPWSKWSSCSKSCGGGTSRRTRTCRAEIGSCKGTPNQSKFCNWEDCKAKSSQSSSRSRKIELVDIPAKISTSSNQRRLVSGPGWTEWARWTTCSRTCGHGEQSRIRQCQDESGKFGRTCDGKPFEKKLCRLKECKPEDNNPKSVSQAPDSSSSAELKPIHPTILQQLLRNAVQLQSLGGNQQAQKQFADQIQYVIQSLPPAQQQAGAQQIQKGLLSLQQTQLATRPQNVPAQTQSLPTAQVPRPGQQSVQNQIAALILQGLQGNAQGQQLLQTLQHGSGQNQQSKPNSFRTPVAARRHSSQQVQQSIPTQPPIAARHSFPQRQRSGNPNSALGFPAPPNQQPPPQFLRASSLPQGQRLSSSIPQTSGRSAAVPSVRFPSPPPEFNQQGQQVATANTGQSRFSQFPPSDRSEFPGFLPSDEEAIETGPIPLPPEVNVPLGESEGPGSLWGPWNDWLPCSKTCAGGLAIRLRYCQGGDSTRCQGNAVERSECNSDIPCGDGGAADRPLVSATRSRAPPPGWTSWGPWSRCSATCGIGVASRLRNCLPGARCDPNDRQTKDCNDGPCGGRRFRGQASGWGLWSSWTECSLSCGGGFTFRQRDCLGPNEDACTGGTKQRKPCNTHQCPPRSSFNPRDQWRNQNQPSSSRTVQSERILPATFPPPSPPETIPSSQIRPLPPQDFKEFDRFGAAPPLPPRGFDPNAAALDRREDIFRSKNQIVRPPGIPDQQPQRTVTNPPVRQSELEEDIFFPNKPFVRPPGFQRPRSSNQRPVTAAPIRTRSRGIPTRAPVDTSSKCRWTPWGNWSRCKGVCPGTRTRTKLCVCGRGEPKSVCKSKRIRTSSTCPRGQCRKPTNRRRG